MEYGTVKKITKSRNKDSDREVWLLDVEIREDDHVDVELDASQFTDCVPRIGSRVYFEEMTTTYHVATRLVDEDAGIDETLKEGERLTYAVDATGKRVATIRQEVNEEIILNGGSEQAMLGNVFLSIYNGLTVPTAFGPSGVPIVPLTVADLSQKVKLK